MHDYEEDGKYRNYNDPEIYHSPSDAEEGKRRRAQAVNTPQDVPMPDMKNADSVGCASLFLPSILFYVICVYPAMGASAMLALSSQPLRLIGLCFYGLWWVISGILLLPCFLAPLIPNKVIAGVLTFFAMVIWMALLNYFVASRWSEKRKTMKKALLAVLLITVLPVSLAWYAHSSGAVNQRYWQQGWAGYDPLTGLIYHGRVGDAFRGY